MNIRQAILKAADHIEKNPSDYEFTTNRKPSCGTPGCMLGWIGVYLGVQEPVHPDDWTIEVAKAIGTTLGDFINHRVYQANGATCSLAHWQDYPEEAAKTLRLYADKYHPAERTVRTGLPDVVRAIFTNPQPVLPTTAEEWMALHDRTIAALK